MKISNLTIGQKKALLKSLEYQTSPKTPAERRVLNELRNNLSEYAETLVEGYELKRCGDFIQLSNFDNCGFNHKNHWVKIQNNSKGEFFSMAYLDNKRIFIR